MHALMLSIAAAALAIGPYLHAPSARLLEQRPPSPLDGSRVPLDELEEHPDRYMGLRLTVTGSVDDVLGPRIFTLADPADGDEVLVALPAPGVATVRGGEPITITGTLKPFAHDEFERSWNWLGLDPEAALEMALKPVLIADMIAAAGGAELIATPAAAQRAVVGTAGSGGAAPDITDVRTTAAGGENLVGRRVALADVRVTGVSAAGYFVQAPGTPLLFVLPAERSDIPRTGDHVSIGGVVLRMPERIEDRLSPPGAMNESVYVYAGTTSVLPRQTAEPIN